ncbi:hypothetical protein EYC84_004578 [Monilinia fructicola]|uniref:Uncharacterized protein n=1 Tax=Monilinia fructicola TaxID=38448 RepID=A0A5M9K5W7_MONFR|nr:hypothetical protein EYC84_004578 [Monilinia fructicola]
MLTTNNAFYLEFFYVPSFRHWLVGHDNHVPRQLECLESISTTVTTTILPTTSSTTCDISTSFYNSISANYSLSFAFDETTQRLPPNLNITICDFLNIIKGFANNETFYLGVASSK